MESGERFYAEQISHHPPVTSFLLEDPDDDYKFYGYHEFKAWLSGPESLGGSRVGIWTLKFKDGVEYKFQKNPIMTINGLLKPPQVQNYKNHAEIVDVTNKLVGDIHYNPWQDNSIKGQTLKTLKWAFGRKKKADDTIEVI